LADVIANRRGEMNDKFDPGPAIANKRLLGVLFFIAAILVAGLPPFSGFIGKFLILQAALNHSMLPWIMSIVLMTSLLGLIALARSGSLLFYRIQTVEAIVHDPGAYNAARTRSVIIELIPIISLLMLCLALVIGAGPITEFSLATANQLLQPATYIQAVLGNGEIF
jgi:multicomponent K+:H+ antiporter subunit D